MKTDPREDVAGLAQLENNNNLFKEEKADSNEQKQHPPRIVMVYIKKLLLKINLILFRNRSLAQTSPKLRKNCA